MVIVWSYHHWSAAEFDYYAGTQACLALKEEGYSVVLVNLTLRLSRLIKKSQTRFTLNHFTLEFVTRILRKERPDAPLCQHFLVDKLV